MFPKASTVMEASRRRVEAKRVLRRDLLAKGVPLPVVLSMLPTLNILVDGDLGKDGKHEEHE